MIVFLSETLINETFANFVSLLRALLVTHNTTTVRPFWTNISFPLDGERTP
jgi:hypothetical protein